MRCYLYVASVCEYMYRSSQVRELSWSYCFFFQAEDGIRDLVRSRGLGDVYKRQGYMFTDIYKNLLGDIRTGIMFQGENSYFLGQAGIKVYPLNQETDLSLALAVKTDFKHDISVYPVLEVSSRIFYDLLRYSAGFYFGKESLGFLSLNVCF